MESMKWDKIITTEQEYEKALKRLSAIFESNPDSPEGMEAELLGLPGEVLIQPSDLDSKP